VGVPTGRATLLAETGALDGKWVTLRYSRLDERPNRDGRPDTLGRIKSHPLPLCGVGLSFFIAVIRSCGPDPVHTTALWLGLDLSSCAVQAKSMTTLRNVCAPMLAETAGTVRHPSWEWGYARSPVQHVELHWRRPRATYFFGESNLRGMSGRENNGELHKCPKNRR
jgi:hypothetical protein